MSQKLEKDVARLRCYVVTLNVILVVLGIAAFRPQAAARFEVLDVERLNVVTKEGKYAVVISNAQRLPGNVIGGREYAVDGGRGAGMLFFNRDGDEAGALIFDNRGRDTSLFAFGQLSIDRYGSDQVAAVRYLEGLQGWEAGLDVSYFPRGNLLEWFPARDSIASLPEAQRAAALQRLRARFIREGKFEVKRVFVGEANRDAIIRLNDIRGRPRIRMIVDSLGVARLEFLDDRGNVVNRLP